jgi:hypothetical protein
MTNTGVTYLSQLELGPVATLCSLPGTSDFVGSAADSTGTGEVGIDDAPLSAKNRLRVEFHLVLSPSGSMRAGTPTPQQVRE